MRIIQQFIPTILFIFLLMSCQSTPVNVTFEAKKTVSFTGRGAAAGVMLDSLIPGGIAIGIAIDEGIAKEIEDNIRKNNPQFDFPGLVKSRLKLIKNKNITSINIKTYGFKSVPGQDQVSALLAFDIISNGQQKQIRYPDDFVNVKTEDFSKVKEDSLVAIGLLTIAIGDIFKK